MPAPVASSPVDASGGARRSGAAGAWMGDQTVRGCCRRGGTGLERRCGAAGGSPNLRAAVRSDRTPGTVRDAHLRAHKEYRHCLGGWTPLDGLSHLSSGRRAGLRSRPKKNRSATSRPLSKSLKSRWPHMIPPRKQSEWKLGRLKGMIVGLRLSIREMTATLRRGPLQMTWVPPERDGLNGL